MFPERAPAAAAAAPSGGEGAKFSSFAGLMQQAGQAHDAEVGLLRREVQRLSAELAAATTADVHSPRGGCADAGQKVLPAMGEIPPAPLDGVEAPALISSFDEAVEDDEPSAGQMSPHSPHNLRRGLSSTLHARMESKRVADEKGALWKLAQHPAVEIIIAAVIITMGVTMAVEAQIESYDLALWTGHASASRPSGEMWPNAQPVFVALNWVFGIFFLLEIVFKLVALRAAFFSDCWNWIDLSLVLLWWAGKLLDSLVNAQLLRIARLVRLCRLVRLIKDMNSSFDSLYLMTTSLRSSMSVLFWTFIMMLVLHLLLALLINQILRAVYFDAESSGQTEVFIYFGSFSRAFLTMFEITLANWPKACRVLVENVSEVFIIYSVLHKMILGFAVVGIVNGIFVQETFKVTAADNSVMVRQTIHRQKTHCNKMRALFEEADTNADGRIDKGEWQEVCKDEWVRNWLLSQDIHARDAMTLWEMLDDGDGELTAEELIHGTARLKGPAASMSMIAKINQIEACMKEINDELLANRAVAVERDSRPRC